MDGTNGVDGVDGVNDQPDLGDLGDLGELVDLLAGLDTETLTEMVDQLPPQWLPPILNHLDITPNPTGLALPTDPAAQATQLDPGYRLRPHVAHLSTRLAAATRDVEQGTSRYLSVSMPPRSGKSTLASLYLPTWLLRAHPDWSIGMISHEANFATSWGRQVRRVIEQNPNLGVNLARDLGAASEWETIERGGILARSVGGSITGRGFRVLLLDDVVKDFVAAHSAQTRQSTWDWWLSVALTRLEPPYLVIAIGTRWHEDDFLGRLLSSDYEGDARQWEEIRFPAIAEEADVLGRAPGEPLLSPLVDETPTQALERWEDLRASVGSYTWAAQFQQRPAPARGAIFDTAWWRYWTTNPTRATKAAEDGDDGRVVYLDPEELEPGARVVDSWDMAFKGTDTSDYVVGQRWARIGPHRYLLAQQRGRWSFTQTLPQVQSWEHSGPAHAHVFERLVEEKANGAAVIDVLRDKIPGLIPINPKDPKEVRARAVTPEVEAGNVYLPHPADPGNEWVQDLLAELRDFPSGAHDDQVDALTQALRRLRDPGHGSVTVPGRVTRLPGRRTQASNLTARTITPRKYG